MVDLPIDESIKAALVRLLEQKTVAEVSVAELCREAHIARGTFYRRFSNIQDVYQQLVLDAADSSRSINEQMACIRCGTEPNRPEFCELAKSYACYRAVIREPTFLATLLHLEGARMRRHFEQMADRIGLTPEQARAVYTFQISGCHSLATGDLPDSPDWDEARAAVDCFIAGGFAALSAQYGASAER